MTTTFSGLDYTDLRFLGYPDIIATGILHGTPPGAALALVDPGPHTTLDTLTADLARRGLSIADVTDLLVTHIHLDHSGCAGHLVRLNPRITVHVHEAGAPHLVDPSRLLSSAARLYGSDMQRLWGEILPVPAGNLHALRGGERVALGGRRLRIAYTPGHAVHHVSYLDETSGVAFVGDTLGIRRPPGTYVMPPAPPPDVDLQAWPESVRGILSWRPSAVFVTHFGPFDNVEEHAGEFVGRLEEWASHAKRLLADPSLTDAERCDRFVESVRDELRRRMPVADADAYERSGRIDYSWQGLARAIRKSEGLRSMA